MESHSTDCCNGDTHSHTGTHCCINKASNYSNFCVRGTKLHILELTLATEIGGLILELDFASEIQSLMPKHVDTHSGIQSVLLELAVAPEIPNLIAELTIATEINQPSRAR